MRARVRACARAHMHVRMHVRMYACTHVRMYVFMGVFIIFRRGSRTFFFTPQRHIMALYSGMLSFSQQLCHLHSSITAEL